MRAALVCVVLVCTVLGSVVLAACAEPTGRTQVWPPSRGITVEGIAFGDLDGDGATEVAVMSSGDEHAGGVYLLRGSGDLALGSPMYPLATFSNYAAFAVKHPATVSIVSNPPLVLGAMLGGDFNGLVEHEYDKTLAEQFSMYGTIDENSALLWQRPVMFPGNTPHLIVSNGVAMEHFDVVEGTSNTINGPNMQPWVTAEVAMTYASGANQIIVVATPTTIVQAIIPPMPPGGSETYSWQTVRDGASWVGVTALDLGGGHDVILGVDSVAHQLCADDPALPGEHCIALPGTSAHTEIGMVVVKTANVYDLYVTQSDAMTTDVSVLTNIVLDGSGLTGTGDVRPSQALPHGRPLAVNAHAGETPHVVIMASDGHVACVKQPC